MSPESPLTPREIARLIQAVDSLTSTIENLRQEMAATYVRKDVYEADRRADEESGNRLAGRLDKQEGYWSRLAWTVGLMVLTALMGLVLAQGGQVPGQ